MKFFERTTSCTLNLGVGNQLACRPNQCPQGARFLGPRVAACAVFPGIAIAVRRAAASAMKAANAMAANGRRLAGHFRPLRAASAARRRLKPRDLREHVR